jgi:hypothetical protein
VNSGNAVVAVLRVFDIPGEESTERRCDAHAIAGAMRLQPGNYELVLRKPDSVREALLRLHAWVLEQEGESTFDGDHPIAQAAAALYGAPPFCTDGVKESA